MLAENLNLNCPNLNNNAKLSLFHLNIRSISRKLDNLTIFLGSLALDFSIIGLTETWLDNPITYQILRGIILSTILDVKELEEVSAFIFPSI